MATLDATVPPDPLDDKMNRPDPLDDKMNTPYSAIENSKTVWDRHIELLDKPGDDANKTRIIQQHLRTLEKLTRKTLTEAKENIKPRFYKLFTQNYRSIFKIKDSVTSLTQLNIISFQCAILFTIIYRNTLIEGDKVRGHLQYDHPEYDDDRFVDSGNVYRDIIKIDWFIYDTMLNYINTGTVWNVYLNCLIEEEGKSKVLISPLGDMTLYQLISSSANDIYLLGLSPTVVFADGRKMSPLTFILHDISHMEIRNGIKGRYSGFGSTEEIRRNIQTYLSHIRDRPDISHECLIWLFLIMHEAVFERNPKNKVIQPPFIIYMKENSEDLKKYKELLPGFQQEKYILGYGKIHLTIDDLWVYSRSAQEAVPFLDEFPKRCIPQSPDGFDAYNFYNGILPESIKLQTNTEADYSKKIEIIRGWLSRSWNNFKDSWNSVIAQDNSDLRAQDEANTLKNIAAANAFAGKLMKKYENDKPLSKSPKLGPKALATTRKASSRASSKKTSASAKKPPTRRVPKGPKPLGRIKED